MLPRLSRRADRFRALAVLTALLPAAAMAQATEEVVTLSSQGQDVVGTLQLPDGEAAPVVLLLHGFTGSRDELVTEAVPDGVFGHAANLLADAGYASLRIDFRGSGDSVADMNFAQTTFETQVADGLAALDWLAQAPQVDADRLFVIGWSQGGLVATAVVGRSGETVDAAALWAAASMPVETFTGLLGDAAMAEGAAAAPDAPVTVTLPWGAEIDLNGAYFAGLTSFDAAAEIASYGGPLFVAQGTLDTTVAPASADVLIAAHDGEEQLWLRDMDHTFNAFTTTDMLDDMVAATIAWFDAHPGP